MEEKILTKSKRYEIKKILWSIFICVAIICVWVYLSEFITEVQRVSDWCDCTDPWDYKYCTVHDDNDTIVGLAWRFSDDTFWVTFGIAGGIGLICLLVHAWMRSFEITITDKRIFGKAAFGKRVELPVDSVSAVGTKWPNGITIATSSGKIAFLLIQNRDEIHKCVSDLLVERQSKAVAAAPDAKPVPTQSVADELKKYKELLDIGAITQEEFDAKKKQLLGL